MYTAVPTATSTSLAQTHWSAASAPGPDTTYFENDVWSKTATAPRVARCSAADHGCQFCRPQAYSIRASAGDGAKTFGRSQPIRDPNTAPAAASRSWTGESRTSRALSSSRLGHGTA